MKNKKYICPICGYDKLEQGPAESYEICHCCGYEFGTCEYFNNSNQPVDVGYKFNYKEDKDFYKYLRGLWLKQGAKWWREESKPQGWDLIKQLNNLDGILFETNRTAGEFLEFQFCEKENLKDIFDMENIQNWKSDSLYVDFSTNLFDEYIDLLSIALLPNGTTGFDPYGINYYNSEKTHALCKQIKEKQGLLDKTILINWLEKAVKLEKGFYILGV